LNITEAWQKITGTDAQMGRAGWIPVYDGGWRIFRSTHTIWPGLENLADPNEVDRLRHNAMSLLDHYPETMNQLEKLGVRVKGLLNKPIKTQADVAQWAESIFNTGPVLDSLPPHVADAMALGYPDFKVIVSSGRHPQYVLPAGPYGTTKQTVNYNVPGSRLKFGPRHEFSKAAWSLQAPVTPQNPTKRYRGTLDENGATRPRGRPRKDGLTSGSKEAKAADAQKKRDLAKQAKDRARQREMDRKLRTKPVRTPKPSPNGEATITPLPTRRILARVGGESA
jgi:hypothetical protein